MLTVKEMHGVCGEVVPLLVPLLPLPQLAGGKVPPAGRRLHEGGEGRQGHEGAVLRGVELGGGRVAPGEVHLALQRVETGGGGRPRGQESRPTRVHCK